VAEPISTGAAILGAGALGAGAGVLGSSQAARAQKSAAGQAADTQREMLERQIELQEPFRQGGMTAQNRLMELLGIGGEEGAPSYGRFARDFGMSDFQADPGYGFRMSEGMKALERSAALTVREQWVAELTVAQMEALAEEPVAEPVVVSSTTHPQSSSAPTKTSWPRARPRSSASP
jgi:hypothetical protein